MSDLRAMPDYPSEFPTQAVSHLIAFLRGSNYDTAVIAKACWLVAGFALHAALPEAIPVAHVQYGPEGRMLTENDRHYLAATLERATAGEMHFDQAEWQGVLQLVLALILQLLKNS